VSPLKLQIVPKTEAAEVEQLNLQSRLSLDGQEIIRGERLDDESLQPVHVVNVIVKEESERVEGNNGKTRKRSSKRRRVESSVRNTSS